MKVQKTVHFLLETSVYMVVFAFAFAVIGNTSPRVYHAYVRGLEPQPMVAGACVVNGGE